jgi:hypothetical protein
MDLILAKLLTAITDPVNIILLLWIWWFIRDRGDLIEINDKLLSAQQNRGETLTKLMTTLDSVHLLVRDIRRTE